MTDRARRSVPDVVAPAVLVILDAAVVVWLWPTLVRSLWFDEAWRAFHLSVGDGWFTALQTANAPLSLGWFAVEKLCITLFGNTELVLRLPQIAALVALSLFTYLLGRWWLSRPAATVVAALVTVNGGLLVYGMQLKSYLPEAACSAAAVHLWLCARRRAQAGRAPWRAQLGIALCAITAVTTLFVLAPLLLADVVDTWRVRTGRLGTPAAARLAGSVTVTATGLAHLALFVLPQKYLTTNPYWRDFFLTRSNAADQLLTAVWELPRNAFTAAMTRPDGRFGSPFTGSPLLADPDQRIHLSVIAGVLLCWAIGLVAAVRDRAGRALLLALGGALVLIALASATGRWPVGFVRANLFILPLLYVLAGVGGSVLARALRSAIRRRSRSRWFRPVALCTLAIGTVFVTVFVTSVVLVSAQRVREIRASAAGPLLLGNMRELVAEQQQTSGPGDIQIVIPGRFDERQWYKAQQYYATYYSGYPAPTGQRTPIAETATAVLPPLGWDRAIQEFLAAHPDAGALYLVTYNLVFPDKVHELGYLLTGLGWCPDDSARRFWPLTGQVSRFTRCPNQQ